MKDNGVVLDSRSSSGASSRYDFIDGLRGIAVLWVILHHIWIFFNVRPAFVDLHEALKDRHWDALASGLSLFYVLFDKVSFFGNYGVDLFFVISGFLITGLLIDFLDGRLDIGRFYVRRFFKIVPHYYFFLLIAIAISLVGFREEPRQVYRSFINFFWFLQNYSPGTGVFRHTWSLVIEEQFYLFWALALLIIGSAFKTHEARLKMAVTVGAALIVLVTGYRFYYYHTGHVLFPPKEFFINPVQMTFFRIDALMAGCLVRLFLKQVDALKIASWIIHVLGLVLYLILVTSPKGQVGVPLTAYTLTLTWSASVCLIIAGLRGRFTLSRSAVLQEIGRSSYGIYLVHYPMAFVFMWAIPRSGITQNSLMTALLYGMTCVALGILTTRTVERFFLDLRKKIAP